MPSGGGGSKQSTTTKGTQTSTPYQQDAYGNLLQGADSWMNSGGYDKTYAQGHDTVADLTEAQKLGLAGSQQTAGELSKLYSTSGQSALSDYLGPYDPTKTGLTGAIDAMNNQSNFNFETQINPQIRQGAQGAGQYGSSRHGIAEGLARSQLSQQQLNASQTMAFQDQQNFNQNRTNMLNNLGNITKGLNSASGLMYDSGQLEQQQEQNEIAGLLEKWSYENGIALKDLQAYQSLIQGDMGGTVTSNSQTNAKSDGGGSSPWGTIGMIGGAMLGSMAGPGGTMAGAQLGSMAGSSLSSTQASRM